MTLHIECPSYPNIDKYKADVNAVFYFRVNHYPYYIADLAHEEGDIYKKVKKFFEQWARLKYKGIPINTHTHDPPANIIAFMMNAFDEYKKNKYVFTPNVKSRITFLIEVIKRWTAYKKYLRPVEDVEKEMVYRMSSSIP